MTDDGRFPADEAARLLAEVEARAAAFKSKMDGSSLEPLKMVLREAGGKLPELVLCEAMRELLRTNRTLLEEAPGALRAAAIGCDLRGNGGAHVFTIAQACAYLRGADAMLQAAMGQLTAFIECQKGEPRKEEVLS